MLDDIDILLPYQKRWLADKSTVKIWEKSRRIGATWTEAIDGVLIASSKNHPQDVFFISYNEDAAREFMRDVISWTGHFGVVASQLEEVLIADERKDIKTFQVTYASGKRIMALSSRPTNLRGKQGVTILDEYSFHDDPQGLLKAAIALLMWGGSVRILSTHNGVGSYFNELIEDCRKGKKPYSLHRTTLDDALDEGLYKRICLKLGTQWSKEAQEQWRQDLIDQYGIGADEELFCIPNESGGTYFPRLLVEQNMEQGIPVLRFAMSEAAALASEVQRRSEVQEWLDSQVQEWCKTLHPYYKSSYGFDFARSGDLSYLLVFQEQPNLIRKTAFAVELKNVPFSQQEQILFYIVDRLPRFVAGAHDARGNGQSLAEKATDRYGGYRIHQVMLSNPWYLDNFPKYKAAHEDRQVVLPACSDLLDDHRQIVLDKGIPKPSEKKTRGTRGEQRHADGAVACVLAWFASCQESAGIHALPSMEFSGW